MILDVLTWAAGLFTLMFITWIFFLAAMSLLWAVKKEKITKPAFVFGTVAVWIGRVLNLLSNTVPISILLLEFPREFAISNRVKRHIEYPAPEYGRGLIGRARAGWYALMRPWRLAVCTWIRVHLLSYFDLTGKHG